MISDTSVAFRPCEEISEIALMTMARNEHTGPVDGRFLRVGPTLQIAMEEISWEFTRATGPGGQHVNRTETAVRLRFSPLSSASLPAAVRERIVKQNAARLTSDGELLIVAQKYRSQKRNRADALERLAEIVLAAAKAPVPRRATKPTRASKERRLLAKRIRSETKRLRQGGEH
jgi:ribosome-associated protein